MNSQPLDSCPGRQLAGFLLSLQTRRRPTLSAALLGGAKLQCRKEQAQNVSHDKNQPRQPTARKQQMQALELQHGVRVPS